MYNFGIILALLLFSPTNLLGATNYCDPALCQSQDGVVKHHIACNNNGDFSSNCKQPSMVLMTAQLIESILYSHNNLRNIVANGTLTGFQTASRMATLAWDSELEYLTSLNVRQCQMKHDECHNTELYKFSGQNLAILSQSAVIPPREYQSVIVYMLNKWFDENVLATQDDMDKCSDGSLKKGFGHFVQMIQDKTSKVGCSIITYIDGEGGRKWYVVLMACNYSFGNIVDLPVYVKGPMCSNCETGCNPEFNGLCSTSEIILPFPDMHETSNRNSAITPTQTNDTISDRPSSGISSIARYSDHSIQVLTRSNKPFLSPSSGSSNGSPVQSASLMGMPRSINSPQSRQSDQSKFYRSFVPVPLIKTIQAATSSPSPIQRNQIEPPFYLGTTERLIRRRHCPTVRSVRRRSFVRPVRRSVPTSSYRELAQPLLPVPRTVVLLGDAIKSIVTWFIIP